jgi:succinate dehydrogenase / fumarate reductase iron-sulfur subunit
MNVCIKIFRHDPASDEQGRFVEYDVPFEEGMSVLDAVNYVSNYIDTSLSVRWNCKAARCGSCAAEIDNIPKLMCKTKITSDSVTVGPMRAFPLVKDLVTDITSNYDKLRSIKPFTPGKAQSGVWRMNEDDVVRSQEFRKCIECYLCMDVCHVMRLHNTNYVGPRHVIKAASIDMHPLDSLDRSVELKEKHGLGYCNVTKCCQDVCPEKIQITDNAIIPEKERAADAIYDPIIRLIRKIRGVK